MKQKTFEEVYNIMLRSQIQKTYGEFLKIVKKNIKALCDNRVFFSVVIVNDDSEMTLYELIDAWTFSKSIEPRYRLYRTAVFHDVERDDKIHEIVVKIM